ncbi:vWA domain-containing protein [Risungbinella massiliensis]|uniref:vWA domain-containing protein n=1 Tax=Risungbinella massiliensis TaxID=1329796 RepID=UPI000A975506|nr:VWA domain-containing protein [Risungbinella massiliensis]
MEDKKKYEDNLQEDLMPEEMEMEDKMADDFDDQMPFEGVEFAENPEPRCPCILLLDTSGSMRGEPIEELNQGLASFKDELMSDDMAMKRVELAVVSFGPVTVESEFQTADQFQAPYLTAENDTPIGAAVDQALKMLEERKEQYRENGIDYYRPWVFLITDGAPTDDWRRAAEKIQAAEDAKSLMFFAVGVDRANMKILEEISVREPLKLKGLKFRELFSWLSHSLSTVSHSQMGETVTLTSPAGWGKVE